MKKILAIIILILLYLAILSSPLSAQSQWHLVSSGKTNNLNGITNSGNGTLTIVGDDSDISIIPADSDYVRPRTVNNPNGKKLYDVHFYDDPYSPGQYGAAVGEQGTVYITSDGGESWNPVFSGTSNKLNKIFFGRCPTSGDSWGYAVGNNSTILVTTDKGATWNKQTTTYQYDHLYDTHFINNAEGWAVGSTGIIYSTSNSGFNWNYVPGDQSNPNLYAVHFVSNTTGWVAGDSGTVLKTTNHGNNWTLQHTGTSNTIRDIKFTSNDSGYVVGTHGTLLETTDGGNNWNSISTNRTENFNALALDDDNNVWIVGDSGVVYTNRRTVAVGIRDKKSIPVNTELLPAYPNPFNPGTNIKYTLSEPSRVSLLIFDILGRTVASLAYNEYKSGGSYSVYWNADGFTNGVYIAVLQTAKTVKAQKLILLK